MITPIVHLLHTAVAFFIIASSPMTQTEIDNAITFAPDGNVYITQEVCDLKDFRPGPELTERFEKWDAAVRAGKIDGRIICVD